MCVNFAPPPQFQPFSGTHPHMAVRGIAATAAAFFCHRTSEAKVLIGIWLTRLVKAIIVYKATGKAGQVQDHNLWHAYHR